MINKLFKKYPYNRSYKYYVLISFLIFLLLCIFHPFGLSALPGSIEYAAEFGYGLITFIILITNAKLLPNLFPQFFAKERWKIYKEIIMICWNIISIGVGNTFYSYALGFNKLNLESTLSFIGITAIVSIFPVTILILIKDHRRLKNNLQDARKMNDKVGSGQNKKMDKNRNFLYQGDLKKDKVKLKADQIFYIKSQNNYLEFYYAKNGKIISNTIRGALKNVEEYCSKFDFLQRCHRSYIVNIDKIKNIEGNSLGYKVLLNENIKRIPVSRSYTKKFKQDILGN